MDRNVAFRGGIVEFTLVDIHGSKLFYLTVSTPGESIGNMRYERQLHWQFWKQLESYHIAEEGK